MLAGVTFTKKQRNKKVKKANEKHNNRESPESTRGKTEKQLEVLLCLYQDKRGMFSYL